MAEVVDSKSPIPSPKTQQESSTWFLPNFLTKAIVFFVLIALLPLFPSQAPETLNHSFLTTTWELLHLLFVGIAISYGLFSRRNAETELDKEIPASSKPDNTPQSYLSRILHVSSVFDEPAGTFDESKTETWSSQYYRGEPVVMVAEGEDGRNKPLSLPVRRLRDSSDEYAELSNGLGDASKKNVVLPSPIPWRSRSGRMEVKEDLGGGASATTDTITKTPSFRSQVTPSGSCAVPSPKKLSHSSSSPSMEVRAKASEDTVRKKSFYNSAPPPAPPPPPPPPFAHSSPPFPERRDTRKSFKEELKDLSRGRERLISNNEAIPRNQIGGSSLGRSVRTVRSKEAQDEFLQTEPSPERMSSEKRNELTSDDSDSDEASRTSDHEDVRNNGVDAGPDEHEVDKKADEFIAKFREQIRLQRIDSIKRSTGQRAVRSTK